MIIAFHAVKSHLNPCDPKDLGCKSHWNNSQNLNQFPLKFHFGGVQSHWHPTMWWCQVPFLGTSPTFPHLGRLLHHANSAPRVACGSCTSAGFREGSTVNGRPIGEITSTKWINLGKSQWIQARLGYSCLGENVLKTCLVDLQISWHRFDFSKDQAVDGAAPDSVVTIKSRTLGRSSSDCIPHLSHICRVKFTSCFVQRTAVHIVFRAKKKPTDLFNQLAYWC